MKKGGARAHEEEGAMGGQERASASALRAASLSGAGPHRWSGKLYVEDFGMVMREGMASWMMRCALGRRWDIGPRFKGGMGEAPSSWESEMTTVLTDWALERIEGGLRA